MTAPQNNNSRVKADAVSAGSMTSSKRQLQVIMAIALFSLGGSYLLFYLANSGAGWGTTNNGEFVTPPTTIANLGWPRGADSRNWRLWVVADKVCEAACVDKVTKLRALHILLTKEASRVRRAVTLQGGDSQQLDLPEAFPKLERINLTPAQDLVSGVYIIDPNGNLVFRYEMHIDPQLILIDLKKLLKLSQIG